MTFTLAEIIGLASVALTIIALAGGMVRWSHGRVMDRLTREVAAIKQDLEKDVDRVEKNLETASQQRSNQIAEVHRRIDEVNDELKNTPTKQDFQNVMGSVTGVLEALRQDLRHVSGRIDTIFEKLPPAPPSNQ